MKKWTTGEVAKQRNISLRTLRYYDHIDLLTPSQRDESGKRYYSEEDLFQLEKILILKSLSLPLEDIRNLLAKLSYKQILVSHYNHLQEQLSALQGSISNTASLLNMLDVEESLSWEHVAALIRNSETSAKKWMDYFQEDEREFLQQQLPKLHNNDAITHKYITIIKEIERCLAHNIPPESDEGRQIGQTLIQLSEETFQGDQALMEEFWKVRKRPAEETGLYPLSDEVLSYVERCIAYADTF